MGACEIEDAVDGSSRFDVGKERSGWSIPFLDDFLPLNTLRQTTAI